MKTSISDTIIGKQSNLADYRKTALRFLVDNRDSIVIDSDTAVSMLKNTNTLLNTPITELYRSIISEEKLSLFTLLDLSNIKQIPSAFLITWLDIDVLQIKHDAPSLHTVVSSIPEYCDQIIVDITPFVSTKTNTISDVAAVQLRIVRDLLCRSYTQFDTMWLTPTIMYYITKLYSNMVASKLGRIYNLNYQETFTIATIMSVFFTLQCSTSDDVVNPVMYKMDFLTRMVDTKQIYRHISDKYSASEFDLAAVVATIVALSPARLSKLSLASFMAMHTNFGSSQIISLLNVEYPPYFVASTLGALSGDKSSIYYQIRQLNLKKDADALAKELLGTNSFIKSTY